MLRVLLYLLAIVALTAAGFVMLSADGRLALPSRPEPQEPTQILRTFSWRFTTKEASADGLPPRTDVALITGGDTYNFGGYPGTCAEITPENLLPDEVSGVLCWWAGAGDEVGVFLIEGNYIVRRGFQEEPTAESEGFRGNFGDILTLE